MNGEIELGTSVCTMSNGESIPVMWDMEPDFDIKEVPGGITFENISSFQFDPQEGLLWEGYALVDIDNQTFKKPFRVLLYVDGVKDLKNGEKMHWSNRGIVSIGNNVWSPIFGSVTTATVGAPTSVCIYTVMWIISQI